MRIVSKKEDLRIDEEFRFYRLLVESLRAEICQIRAQIDEVRELPIPYDSNGKKARVHVLNDKNVAKLQRGEPLDEE